jgi:hypothetical protein
MGVFDKKWWFLHRKWVFFEVFYGKWGVLSGFEVFLHRKWVFLMGNGCFYIWNGCIFGYFDAKTRFERWFLGFKGYFVIGKVYILVRNVVFLNGNMNFSRYVFFWGGRDTKTPTTTANSHSHTF